MISEFGFAPQSIFDLCFPDCHDQNINLILLLFRSLIVVFPDNHQLHIDKTKKEGSIVHEEQSSQKKKKDKRLKHDSDDEDDGKKFSILF